MKQVSEKKGYWFWWWNKHGEVIVISSAILGVVALFILTSYGVYLFLISAPTIIVTAVAIVTICILIGFGCWLSYNDYLQETRNQA